MPTRNMVAPETELEILASPHAAALAPDGKHLVFGAPSGVFACDLTGKKTHTFAKSSYWSDVYVARKKVVAQVASFIRVFDWRSKKLVTEYRPPGYETLRSVSTDGRFALTTSFAPSSKKNKAFTVWDLSKKCAVAQHQEKKSFVMDAALSPDASAVVYGGTDGYVRFLDVRSGQIWGTAKGRGSIDVVARSDDGRFFATGGRGGAVLVWNAGGSLHRSFPYAKRATALALSPDGSLLVACAAKAAPQAWDVSSGKPALTFDAPGARSARFSADGSRVVFASSDYRVRVYRLASVIWRDDEGPLAAAPASDGVAYRAEPALQAPGGRRARGSRA